MEFKERLEQLLEKNDITQKQLIIEFMENKGQAVNANTLKSAESNYSNKLSGNGRYLNHEEIAYLENRLHTTMAYLVNGDEVDEPHLTLQKIAYSDDPIQLKAFISQFESSRILAYKQDEYGNTLFDYVFKYKDKNKEHNIVASLINDYGMKLDVYNRFLALGASDGLIYPIRNETDELSTAKVILEMVCEKDDPKLFNKFLANKPNLAKLIYERHIFNDEDVCEIIANTNKIFKSFLKYEIRTSEIEFPTKMGTYEKMNVYSTNGAINYILDFIMKHLDKYKDKATQTIEFAIDYNRKVVKCFDDFDLKGYEVLKSGVIRTRGECVSVLLKINTPDSLYCSDEILQLIDKAKEEYLDHCSYITGSWPGSESSIRRDRIGVIKQRTNNQYEYDFLELMKENKYSKVPLIVKQSEEYDWFKYVSGSKYYSIYSKPDEDVIYSLVYELKQINEISKKKLNGKVYCHGDLTNENVLFQNNEVIAILDWDEIYVGEEYDNFLDLFINWGKLDQALFDSDFYFELLKEMIYAYEPDNEFKKGFTDKIIERIKYHQNKINFKAANAEIKYMKYGTAKAWAELYRTRIEKEIG